MRRTRVLILIVAIIAGAIVGEHLRRGVLWNAAPILAKASQLGFSSLGFGP
jgi:hypothetical protein